MGECASLDAWGHHLSRFLGTLNYLGYEVNCCYIIQNYGYSNQNNMIGRKIEVAMSIKGI